MTQFSERLKKARESAGMAKAVLAKAVGVSATSIGRYEDGSRKPDGDITMRLANALGVSVAWLGKGTKEYVYVSTQNGCRRVEKEVDWQPDKTPPEEPAEEEPVQDAPTNTIETEVKIPELNPMAESLDWNRKEPIAEYATKATGEVLWTDCVDCVLQERVERLESEWCAREERQPLIRTKYEAFILGTVTGFVLMALIMIVVLLLR